MYAIFLIVAFVCAEAITFDLPYGQQNCFGEDFLPRTTVQTEVHVLTGRGGGGGVDMKLDVSVSNAGGTVIAHHSDASTVKFSFVTGHYKSTSSQPYRVCVRHQPNNDMHQPGAVSAYRRVMLSLTPAVKNVDSDMYLTHDDADQILLSLNNLSRSVANVIKEIDQIRTLEDTLSDEANHTTPMIIRFSILACLFTILTGFINVGFLKALWKKKKMI